MDAMIFFAGWERERFCQGSGRRQEFGKATVFTPAELAELSNGLSLVSLDNVLAQAKQSGRLGDRGDRRRFGEFEVDDLYLVAALLVEADRRAH